MFLPSPESSFKHVIEDDRSQKSGSMEEGIDESFRDFLKGWFNTSKKPQTLFSWSARSHCQGAEFL